MPSVLCLVAAHGDLSYALMDQPAPAGGTSFTPLFSSYQCRSAKLLGVLKRGKIGQSRLVSTAGLRAGAGGGDG